MAIYRRESAHFPSRTFQLFDNCLNLIEPLSNLMKTGDAQKGFKDLRDKKLLDFSFEKIIMNYPEQFDKDIVEVATFRYENSDKLP